MEQRWLYLFLFMIIATCVCAQRRRIGPRRRLKDIRGRIIGEIRGDTYSPDLNSVIPGSSSLAFVFDVTGSMWDDLKQVTAGARQILDTTRSRAEKPLHNYVLIPFHDPVVGPSIVTSNPRTFTRALKNLYVQGGGDCPEMSVTAIREALLISLPGSFIYVFTDARSKDFHQLPEVLKIIQRKQSQVVFVLTGDCDDQNHKGYKAYEKIAATSSGQVFLITKDDVSEVVKFIEVSVQAHKVLLLATDHARGGRHDWSLPLDPELHEITISLSGPGRRLTLVDPDGTTMTEENGLETLLDLENVQIVNIKNPKPGLWRLSAHGSGEHSLRVTGLSTLDFQARFSRKPTFNWTETEYQPVAGIQTYILINATGLEAPGRFRTLRLLDIAGRTLRTVPLSTPRDPTQPYLYTVEPLTVPNRPFYLVVLGTTMEDYHFLRASKNAIINVAPVAPVVDLPTTYPGYFDYPADIPCEISSLIPFDVSWSRESEEGWTDIGRSRSYRDSTIDYLRIQEVTEAAEGTYKCFARNAEGSDFDTTFLDVEERPPIITTHGNETVTPGDEIALTCHVTSNVRFTITWSRVDGQPLDRLRTRKLQNGSLLIQRARLFDEALYQCLVVNIGGESEETIGLIVQRPPVVTIIPSERSSFSLRGTIRIDCSATGLPSPTIEWLKGSTYLFDIGKIRIGRGGTYLEIVNANQDDEGMYTCQASNRAGTHSASVQWAFTEAPVVTIPEADMLVLEGTRVAMRCGANGIPTPRITWSREGANIVTGRKYDITPDGTLVIHQAARTDTGVFECTGTNSAGSSRGEVNLQVGWNPVITNPPRDVGIDFGSNASMPCEADGFPNPEISWFHGRSRVSAGDSERRVLNSETNSLHITTLNLNDEGLYTCSASNIFSTVTATAQLTVTGTALPRLDVGDLVPHVVVGQSIVIPCRIISGNPLPNREWTRRRRILEPTSRTSINDAGSIVIYAAAVDDAGPYICTATNVLGSDSRRVDLDVWVPASIQPEQNRYHTIEGSPISIPCASSGNPAPVVVWQRAGSLRSLEDQSGYEVSDDGTLTVLRPTAESNGMYRCIASNPAGSDSIDIDLDVYLRPRFGNTTKLYSVIVGESITMECEVFASPPPTYTWAKDGSRMNGNEDGVDITPDGRITISAARVSDAGKYTCVATNVAGVVQREMTLDVLVPPRIRRGPSLIKVLVAETATLACHATGSPTPTIYWVRGDDVIREGFNPRFSLLRRDDSVSLIIQNTELNDDDDYTCVAENPAGRDSYSVSLDVQRIPEIGPNSNCIPTPENNQCTATPVESGRLTLTCNATGDPPPTIRWYRNREELDNADPNVRIDTDGTLTLYVVTRVDNGQYICEAENERGIVTEVTNVEVHERPEIEGGGGEVEKLWVLEGDDIDLTCEADAVPPPVITWYRGANHTQLVEEEANHIAFRSSGRIFRITQARVSDTDIYKCTASNRVGKTNKFIRLDVYVRPSIQDNDDVSLQIVNLYDSVDLRCVVSGIPFPEIQWFKGAETLDVDDERIQMLSRKQVLRINSALVTDTSSYKCVVRNRVGDASKHFDLNVHVPPSIRGADTTHTVTVNDHLTLQCIANGIPLPSVQWTFNGVTVTSHLGLRLANDDQVIEIARIQVSDEGSYICTATNDAGRTSRTHTVVVRVPPSIDGDDVSNVTVTLGGNVTLTCDAAGDPPPTVVWMKDGFPIIFSANENIQLTNENRILTITNARESDRGEYTCVASNDVGEETQTHSLDVLVPPVIGNPNEEVIAIEHETTTLSCRVYGHPFPNIRWETFGNPVVENEKFQITNRGQELIITDVLVDDSKQYTCIAGNSVGRATKEVNLIVHVPAAITYPAENRVEHTVNEAERYELRCVANGIPIPQITWFKDGDFLNSRRNFKIKDDGRVLMITRAEVAYHEGAYECIANNGVGDDSREMSLIVNVPPLIHGHSRTKSKVIDLGRSEMLECRIKKGKPTPEIRWYNRDNQEITTSRGVVFTNNKQRLHLLSVQLSDVGNYWCEAINVAGKSRKDFNLDVIVPPNIRGEGDVTKVSVVLDGDITLECHVTGIPTPDITWVKEGTPVSSLRIGQYTVSAGGSRLTVSSATESDAGLYQCVAVNTAGNSSKSFQLDVYLPPSIVGDHIENITVVENSPVTMLCDVDAFPPPQITWFKNSRPLLLGPGIRLSMNDSRLDILWAQEQDTGMYHCEAVNEVGKQRKYFRLKVQVVPTITGPPHTRLEHVVGDQIRMMCDYDGVPRPSVDWTMDNTELPSDVVVQSEGRVLFISDAVVGHSGTFACNASNVAGYDVKTYEVIVYEPPSIKGSDTVERVIVNKGDGIELECSASGTPVPDIVWNKNRRRISRFFDRAQVSDDGRYLTVDEADLEDAGKYACTASNLVGVATKRFEVEIRVPPTIPSNDEIERRWVLRGNNISLTCDADAVPPPSLQWQVNGVPLVASPRIRTQQAGKVLFVSSAKDEDAAMYTCVATNVAGSASRDIQLDVYSTPSIPGSDTIDTHDVNRGRPFSLECNVIGHPRPDIEWLKDGYRIASTVVGIIASSSSGFEMSEDGRYLNVGSADLQHTGDYTCRAVSEAGEDSKQYQVNVRVPPSISDEDSSPPVIRTHVNTPTLLRCSAYGIPSPTIQWLHVNGSSSQVIDVENNERFVVQFGGRYLRITNTLLDDEGDYTCIATNPAGHARKDFQLIVNVPPVIEGSNNLAPTSVGVPTNQTITLNCIIEEGNPFPRIMWWNGKQLLEESDRVRFSSDSQTLEVLESKVSDTGRYQCTAINDAGEDSKSFDVEVQTPPQFPEGEGDTTVDVNEGSPLHIHCKIVAVPMPELTWYKDGNPIQSNDDAYIFPGGRTLQIVSAKPSDAGRYTCVATNNVGSDEKDTDVTVNVPPTIGDGDYDVPDVVRESVNNPFTLECPVTGYPTPTITWYKNGVALDPDDLKYDIAADGQVLTVQNAQEVDSGHYDCRAKNKAGQDSKVFHVNVQTPPSISGPAYQKKIALQNTAVVMPCDASGTPEPTISWLKDEVTLSQTQSGYSVISQGRLLIILQAQTSDTGNFTCVASNVVGRARKTYDVITYVAPLLPTTSGDITVSRGETAVLSCQTNGVPRPEVQWTQNGRALDVEGLNEDDVAKVVLSNNGQILTILDAQETDTGRYMCVVSNDAGIQSKNFKLSVNVPPSIAGPSVVDVISVQGSAVTLFCDVYAVPTARITWMKNGIPVRNSDRVTIVTGETRLQIGSANVYDAASYVCHADNDIGEARKEFHLVVQVPPSVVMSRTEVDIVQGDDETLQCLVSGFPTPEITWFKNGVQISRIVHRNLAVSRDGSSLIIYRAQLSDGAEYVCEAVNVAGRERGSVNVHILVPPMLNTDESEEHIEVNAGNPVTMHCNVTGGIPPPSISWLRNGIPLEISERMQLLSGGKTLQIIQSQESDTATYSCIAINEAGSVNHEFALDVYVPPTFQLDEDREITIFVGESALLDCTVIGTPQPSVAWSKDESPIRGLSPQIETRVRSLADNQQVLITRAQVGDTGRYTCLAISIAGQENKNFDLNVYEPTRIDGSDETPHIVVNVGDPIDLICNASGIPVPVLTWTKNDDQPLIDSSRVLNNGRQMLVQSAQLSDAGTYSCVATSPAGVAEKDFDVTVNQPPTINDRGNDVTAVVGENVTLECKSDAFPPPVLSWFKDGEPLNQHERYLHLIDVQVSDAGNYTCTATNVAGTTSQDTRLSVYEPPTIDAGPSQITATRGDTVKLPCVARGLPTPKIKWRKGSEQLSGDATSGRYVFLEEGSLMVEDVVVDDAGRFVCLASNSAGSERRIIELIVQVPPSIRQGATNVSVSVNNPVTLDCEVEGIPQPTVVWSRSGNDLATSSDPAYTLLGTGSLRIASAAVADTGYYRCIVTNPAGRDYRDISLFVQVPPSISSGPNKITKNPGDFLRIPCDVSGIPSPGVTWFKNGLPIPDDLENVYVDGANGLVIPSISLQDDAIYVCSATNEAGSARHEVELEVHAHPVISSTADRVTVFEGQPASLPCDVSGTPEPTVTWRKGANLIDTNNEKKTIRNDNSLLVFAAQVDDTGSYTCVAQNPAGVTSNSIYLDVYTPPKFDTELPQSMTVVVGESLLLPVSLSGHPEPDITWSKNGQEIPSEDGSLQIPVITSDHEGLYSIRVSNSAGSLTRYMRLIVNSAPDISAVGDSDVVVIEGEQISLDVTLTGKPWPEVTWTKDGEEITRNNLRFRLSNSGSLTIQNARSSDTGHYIGTASNVAGRGAVEFDVLVQLAPLITEAPSDLEVSAGDRVELVCAATGVPVPEIKWKFENQLIPGTSTEIPGKSRLVLEHARPQDSGAYVCEARNPAGARMATGFLIVQSPPKFIDDPDPDQYDSLGATSMLDCSVIADPTPTITWTKNSQVIESRGRFQLLNNGSLLIRGTELDDAGTYTCIAFNDAGTVTRDKNLILESAPVIVTRPKNTIIDAGDTILLDCVANGEPTPTISWNKGSNPVVFDDRTSILSNSSLRIVTSRLTDTGEYECLAVNFKGIDFAVSLVTIRVHGLYSDWSEFGSCSVTCGSGVQLRQRYCNNPPPANGGRDCEGPSSDERTCEQPFCPIDGGYGLWTFWEECSATCGQGTRSRTRECDSPAPQYGGLPCNGPAVEQAVCVGRTCAVHGGWSNWGVWLPCSTSCGEATQIRVRHCNNPSPSGGGAKCFGRDTMTRLCNVKPCPVNGNWASWGAWEFCSVSCGGGTKNRARTCSDPAPAHDGFLCSGPNRQSESCNNDPCSVNGNWASWGTWSDCSRTCGGGQSNRYRSCTNPPPRHGGRFCTGTDSERLACGLRQCAVDGNWSPWRDWSECSSTCGFGQKTRIRLCTNPRPRNAGRWCQGDATQTDRCRDRFCQGGPRQGEGIVFGTINDVSFGGSDIVASGTDIGDDRTRIIAKISDIPPTVGHFLKSQISILTPIYWTMAREIQGAYNGYTLTEGIFDRTVTVEFASGDMVRMTHKAKGVNSNGKLKVEVALEGNVPEVEADTDVEIKDYTEDYVQTGPGSLFAYSDRLISLDGYNMPYTWQHNITYNETRGRMPYLVEQLSSRDIIVEYSETREELTFQMDVTIGKGDPSDRCPSGFLLDRSGMYCKDENECSTLRPCSHQCINVMGSYICGCPNGYMIGPDGRECEDIDECLTDQYVCPPTLDCLNTLGSYRCVVTCGEGFRRAADGRTCEDINECEESDERVCNHVCRNTVGSYICECRHGYRLNSRGQCIDINECLIRGVCRADQRCRNTQGGYQCIDDCPQGREKIRGVCVDINECTSGRHECGPGMICQNTEGGYNCVCPPGFKATGNDPPCTDINECVDFPTSPCPHRCINTIGSFDCICPNGLLYLADQKSCVGLILSSNPHYQHHHQSFSSYRDGQREPIRSRLANQRRNHESHSTLRTGSSPLSRRSRSIIQAGPSFPNLVMRLTRCPPGFVLNEIDGQCKDINECIEYAGICQHSCRNTLGSYDCVCPQGYRVADNGKSCEDIDECAEGLILCRTGQMCFNKRGSVTCIDTPCPPSYVRVSSGGHCLKESSDPNQPRYGIEYKTVALPFGIGADQDLIRLAVYTNGDVLHLNTRFKAHNTFGNPFGIRTDNYKGVVYTTRALSRSRTYHLEAKATSRATDGRVEYETKFIIYISVAAHEF